MQIGSAMPHVAPLPSSLPARPLLPGDSTGPSSPDLIRANQAPATPAQSADGQASLRAEDDQPPGLAAERPAAEAEQLRQEQQQIASLASRDREVRSHEQAHAAVGGAYAGAPSYTYKRGPDGQIYAVGGEVGIDVSPIPGDPQATLRKMEVVQRAALAPAEPSAQDRRVAAQAQAQASQARAELAEMRREEALAAREERRLSAEQRKAAEAAEGEAAPATQQPQSSAPSLELYRNLARLQEPVATVDLLA
ncbi:SprA-related family protein [Pseudomonas sp. 8AS]|uniref:putative metalloprotease CJM1_0395 family protein n=1 Tax=Pseudomonas sp. 8AS TaxID=2653163 RepID=UPI0012F196E0|nr:putative metalloprotease CJM1_0395 family protein [Pseudomonas sp. 8AS]VXB19846.1 SprA-related family protein [Pseudomonas sp. 8AS]